MHFPSFHNFFCSSDRLDGIRIAPKSNFLGVGRKVDGGGALSRPGVCRRGVGFDRISRSSNVSRLAAVSMAASRLATFMVQRSLAISGLRARKYTLNWTGAESAGLIWLSFSWKIWLKRRTEPRYWAVWIHRSTSSLLVESSNRVFRKASISTTKAAVWVGSSSQLVTAL
jgi:hypothetical protein